MTSIYKYKIIYTNQVNFYQFWFFSPNYRFSVWCSYYILCMYDRLKNVLLHFIEYWILIRTRIYTGFSFFNHSFDHIVMSKNSINFCSFYSLCCYNIIIILERYHHFQFHFSNLHTPILTSNLRDRDYIIPIVQHFIQYLICTHTRLVGWKYFIEWLYFIYALCYQFSFGRGQLIIEITQKESTFIYTILNKTCGKRDCKRRRVTWRNEMGRKREFEWSNMKE